MWLLIELVLFRQGIPLFPVDEYFKDKSEFFVLENVSFSADSSSNALFGKQRVVGQNIVLRRTKEVIGEAQRIVRKSPLFGSACV